MIGQKGKNQNDLLSYLKKAMKNEITYFQTGH